MNYLESSTLAFHCRIPILRKREENKVKLEARCEVMVVYTV